MSATKLKRPMSAEELAQVRQLAAGPVMLAELIRCESDLEMLYNIALENGAKPIGSFPPHKRVREVIDQVTAKS